MVGPSCWSGCRTRPAGGRWMAAAAASWAVSSAWEGEGALRGDGRHVPWHAGSYHEIPRPAPPP
eukprot:354349-Chlamydomonas_euryale.AAC.1